MNQLELAWQTYDFHTFTLYDLEESHQSTIKSYKRFLGKDSNPSEIKKKYMRNKLNKSFSIMLTTYNKQLKAIDDLTQLYKSDIDIPIEREFDLRLFAELKDITIAIVKEIEGFRAEVNEFLR